jgi:3-oxoacyl-[acyl-carrier protein] reductase
VAVVTGAGGGLGAVLATGLHAAGYRMALADLDVPAAATVAAALDPTGGTAAAVQLDVREKTAWQHAQADVLARWGDVQVLVHNAAMTAARPVMEIQPEEFDAVMAVNVRGTFLGCQVFGAHFRGRGHGRIVNLASLAGQNGGTATGAHYAASKGAIVTLTKVFARDLAADGVTVNAIAPGPLDTPMVHRAVPAERLQGLKAGIPVGEIGDPRFVASLVVQLASPEAAFATGATWDVNGGLFMR